MTFDYDAFYAENPDGLGAPTQAFVDFFGGYERAGVRVLDIGCGQGRDALFIARLGHHVTGVDLSPKGVADMVQAAAGLSVEGVVADVTTWRPEGQFDVLLIDRTLHMLDDPARYEVFGDLLTALRPGGDLLLADEASNMAGFRRIMAASGRDWREQQMKAKGLLFARDAVAKS
jgi:SAM-dependent methyltransferase